MDKNKIHGIVSVKKVGRNRFYVEYNFATQANNILIHPALTSADYSAVIPLFHVIHMCIVRDISPKLSMQGIVENVSVSPGFGRVIEARRFSRKYSGEDNTPI